MKKILLSVGIILAVLAASGAGCAELNGEGDLEGEGTLKLNLSDAPIDAQNVTGVYITITGIQYHLDGEWITFEEFGDPQKHNLLELTGENFTLLGEFTLPPGHYTQIRFMLDVPEYGMGTPPTNPGCYIEFADNSTEPLFVPSGGETGYKAIGEFTVPEDGEVEVTADFDLRKSVFIAYSVYILNPTIRLIVNDEAGSIRGEITNDSGYEDIIVFAYGAGDWTPTEAADPAADLEPRFPDAITSGKMHDDGDYILAFLAAGTYDLVVAGYDGAEFGEVLTVEVNVEVESGPTSTIVNIELTT